jgi:hypothetical protein
MAVPATQNLTITRGDTEIVVITIKDSTGTAIDITGRTYRAQIRSTKDSASISVSFSCAITNPAAGVVTCTLSAVNSATLSAGKYYWDFEETTSSGVVTTIIAGGVTVLADVSR